MWVLVAFQQAKIVTAETDFPQDPVTLAFVRDIVHVVSVTVEVRTEFQQTTPRVMLYLFAGDFILTRTVVVVGLRSSTVQQTVDPSVADQIEKLLILFRHFKALFFLGFTTEFFVISDFRCLLGSIFAFLIPI